MLGKMAGKYPMDHPQEKPWPASPDRQPAHMRHAVAILATLTVLLAAQADAAQHGLATSSGPAGATAWTAGATERPARRLTVACHHRYRAGVRKSRPRRRVRLTLDNLRDRRGDLQHAFVSGGTPTGLPIPSGRTTNRGPPSTITI